VSQPLPEYPGCPWPVDPACFEDTWDALDSSVQDRAVALASATLTRLTGYRVGNCPITVRPCKRSCADGALSYADMHSTFGPWWPVNYGGVWTNSCGCTTDCSCAALCEVVLPGPVGRIDSVKVDGTALARNEFRVDGRRLVWTGAGDCPWPACQDLSKGDDAAGTFSVTYLNAYPVDGLGAYAAGITANEFAKACTGGKCRLPSGVTSIARQGISMDLATGAFPNGLTGIREVDAYIALWNPNPIRQQAKVWSPDLSQPRVSVTTPTGPLPSGDDIDGGTP
jgi:hypothetical protein